LVALFFARAFNDLAMYLHMLRAGNRSESIATDYAMVGLKK
jgi:hypothetical protein